MSSPARGAANAPERDTHGGAFVDRAQLAQLQHWLRNLYIGDTRPSVTPESIRFPPGAGGSGVTLAKVTGGSGAAHVCSLYADGLTAAATRDNVNVVTGYVATGQTLPFGTGISVIVITGVYHALPGGVWL